MTTHRKGNPYQVPVQLRTHAPRQTEEQVSTRNRTRQPRADEEDEAWAWGKTSNSAVLYDRRDIPPRRTATLDDPKKTRFIQQPRRINSGGLLIVIGLGMFVMILGWIAFNALANWWMVTQNDWTYGRPRTYQTDHVVGHHDSLDHPSHFLALNLNRRVVVIEFPGGDPSKALTYLGPTLLGDGQDLTPVTITFEDRNGDGKPDLNIHIGDQVIVFLNDGTKFNSPPHQ
jgi:hypothetical protein